MQALRRRGRAPLRTAGRPEPPSDRPSGGGPSNCSLRLVVRRLCSLIAPIRPSAPLCLRPMAAGVQPFIRSERAPDERRLWRGAFNTKGFNTKGSGKGGPAQRGPAVALRVLRAGGPFGGRTQFVHGFVDGMRPRRGTVHPGVYPARQPTMAGQVGRGVRDVGAFAHAAPMTGGGWPGQHHRGCMASRSVL